MATVKQKMIADALAKARDWKELAIANREKKKEEKEKEIEDMIKAMKGE